MVKIPPLQSSFGPTHLPLPAPTPPAPSTFPPPPFLPDQSPTNQGFGLWDERNDFHAALTYPILIWNHI